MVRALLDGRKTQTRRLATSPLRRCEVGDRLYVREAYSVAGVFTDVVEVRYQASRGASYTEQVEQVPVERAANAAVTWPGYRPSIHMPRWASRLTLTVEAVRMGPLKSITPEDARDEGVDRRSKKVRQFWLFGATAEQREQIYLQACPWEFADLWDSLHSDEGTRWDDNPDVVALTFRVSRGNIDQVPA